MTAGGTGEVDLSLAPQGPCYDPGAISSVCVQPVFCAYGNPASFTFGGAANSTQGAPGYRQVDMSRFKAFHTWREQAVGFRSDFFTVFNIASYECPDSNIHSTIFGQISSVRSPERQVQLSLRYMF